MPRAGSKRLILMQDGAIAHTAASTTQWLQMQNVELFPWWPANSPDANPIENVWSWMEKRLKHRQYHTNEELWESLQRCWDNVPMGMIKKLFESMPRRLRAIRKARGGNIKY